MWCEGVGNVLHVGTVPYSAKFLRAINFKIFKLNCGIFFKINYFYFLQFYYFAKFTVL